MQAVSAISKGENIQLDAGIKTILAILLGLATALCTSTLELVYFALYLVIITFLLGSDLRFIYKNLLSYGVIIVFPYLCGLGLSLLINYLVAAPAYSGHFTATFFKLIKIFFIWYIGSLYFFTTPIRPITEMLNKVLSPLNALGIPVVKHLNMARVVVNELNCSVSRFKEEIMGQARQNFKNEQLGIKAKLQGLSHILAVFITNSLQQTDQIQEQVELTRIGSQYGFRFAKNEILAILSFIILVFLVW